MEGTFGSENLSSAFLEPVHSEAEIDYSLVYALFTFVSTMEGQISVLKGEALELLDDSNSYWYSYITRWAVKCLSTGEIGYIPAENIETPFEKLARLNRHRNVDVTNVKDVDVVKTNAKQRVVKIQFAEYHTEIYPDGVSDEEEAEQVPDIQKKKTSFLGKFFKPKRKEPKPGLQPQASLESLTEKIEPEPILPQSLMEQITPINVLRIFPGNITLNTTFKSVSYDKDTIITTLIQHSLKKFRVANTDVSQYYMTVTAVDEFGASLQAERRLIPEENINNVLDSFGVQSFLTETKSEGRKGSLSRVRQADGTIRLKVYVDDGEPTKEMIRICVDDQWEEIQVSSEMYISEVVGQARKKFNLGPELLRVFAMHSKLFIGEDGLVMPMIQDAKRMGKPFELMLQKDINPPPNSRVAKPPSRESIKVSPMSDKKMQKRKPTGFYKPEPIVTATHNKSLLAKISQEPRPRKNSSIKADALTHLQLSLFNFMNGTETPKVHQDVLDYDGMLHILDRSIENNLQEPSVYQIFDDLERDIETILKVQLEKASDSRRRSRLSQLYQKQNKGPDVDAEKVFEDLKSTGAELTRLENVDFVNVEFTIDDEHIFVQIQCLC